MYFRVKNTLNHNHYHTSKHLQNIFYFFSVIGWSCNAIYAVKLSWELHSYINVLYITCTAKEIIILLEDLWLINEFNLFPILYL